MVRTFVYCHRLEFPSPSGQTIQVLRDYHALAALGHTVHLFYRAARPLDAAALKRSLDEYGTPLRPALHLHAVPEGHAGRKRMNELVLAACAPAPEHAVVVTRSVREGLLVRRLLAGAAVKVLLVHELHETALPHLVYAEEGRRLRAWWSRRQEAVLFRAVSAIVCTVGSQLALLDRLFPDHAPAAVLPNGVALEQFAALAPAPKQNDGRFRLRYAGQLNAWKHTDVMIEALRYLPDHMLLEMAGGKPQEFDTTRLQLEAAAARHGVPGRVRYHGFLPPVEVPAFLAGADVLLLPLGNNVLARYFTSPMKLFEYAASGVPMVVARQPTTESLVADGEQALFFTPGQARTLAEAVGRIAADPELGHALSARARTWVASFTYDVRARRYLDFLAPLSPDPLPAGSVRP